MGTDPVNVEPQNEPLQSPEIGELAAALAKAQGQIKEAKRDRENPFFKSSYADLGSVWEACREALSSNGLAVIQTLSGYGKLRTTLAHSSGQWIVSLYPINPVKDDPQGLGSAVTYARRYAMAAIVGVAPAGEDDDAERAQGRKAGRDEPTPADVYRKHDVEPPAARESKGSAMPPCPKCGHNKAVIKSKFTAGAFCCWEKSTRAKGCGEKFSVGGPQDEPGAEEGAAVLQ